MATELWSGALLGVEGVPVRVEVELLRRLPGVQVVGLAASAVREAGERVRSALAASGFEWPRQRVLVNLAPADLRKEGTAFDLPIAVGVLAASGQLPEESLHRYLLAGELSLNGELRPVRGVLSLALMARRQGLSGLLLPRGNAPEAAVVRELEVRGARDLAELVAFLRGETELPPARPGRPAGGARELDLAEVRGQALARRALEVAAAGGHNLLFVGPPGCGKTMLASRLPGILPPMTFEEAVETTAIHSVAGVRRPEQGLLLRRPFRAPHHSVSAAGLLGSARLLPGEASLAHNGVLFLDELPEFSRHVLELLRAPLESGRVLLSRARGTVSLPARFSLVAAANPCPCGYHGHPRRACTCSEAERRRYLARLSGPLLDRIDLQVELQPLSADEIVSSRPGEPSAAVRERVLRARERQERRHRGSPYRWNADLRGRAVWEAARLDAEARSLLSGAVERFALSARAAARLVKVARSVADLAGDERVGAPHLAEALQYRDLERALPETRPLAPLPGGDFLEAPP